jgi:hypothetical protein
MFLCVFDFQKRDQDDDIVDHDDADEDVVAKESELSSRTHPLNSIIITDIKGTFVFKPETGVRHEYDRKSQSMILLRNETSI